MPLSSLPVSALIAVAVFVVPAITAIALCITSRRRSVAAPQPATTPSTVKDDEDRREAICKALIVKKVVAEPEHLGDSSIISRLRNSSQSIQFLREFSSVATPHASQDEQHSEEGEGDTVNETDDEGQNLDIEAGSLSHYLPRTSQDENLPRESLEANLPYDTPTGNSDARRNDDLLVASQGANGQTPLRWVEPSNVMEASPRDENETRKPQPPLTSQKSWRTSNTLARKLSRSMLALGSLFDQEHKLKECSICLMRYEVGEEVCCSPNPSCPHEFHKDCMVHWLMNKKECPICRRNYIGCEGEKSS